MYTIKRKFDFTANYFLRNNSVMKEGKFTLILEFKNAALTADDKVIDLDTELSMVENLIGSEFNENVINVSKTYLNYTGIEPNNPTLENLANFFFYHIRPLIWKLTSVEVFQGEFSAKYEPDINPVNSEI